MQRLRRRRRRFCGGVAGHGGGGRVFRGSGCVPSGDAGLRRPFNLDTLLARCAQLEWKPDPATMLFCNGEDTARGTEEFRTLRSRLYHMRERMTLKKVLVTSALPKEGKSFTSANLAQVLVRQHGRRALLIDADLRGPRLAPDAGDDIEPGAVGIPAGTER